MQTIESPAVILPGATIGMVGGGQLGRMFAIAAATMGYHVIIFCESADDPAAQVAHRCVVGKLDDQQAIERFAQQCDCVTLEFENIPAKTIAHCERFAPTYPSANVLAIAQDRLREKTTLQNAGLPVAAFTKVTDPHSLAQAAEQIGLPLILKTAKSGYDGKGQHRIETLQDANQVDWSACDCWVAEQLIRFDREVSVIVARAVDGRAATFPMFENVHANHILDTTSVPAAVSGHVQAMAEQIAITAAQSLQVVGLLCVEMFVCDEQVLVNEVAPRPHNSGHLTIEACRTSQFEQHVRAVCGLPLGDTSLVCPAAAMANLLGDLWIGKSSKQDCQTPNWDASLSIAGIRLHLYGKQAAKRGRKMGHLTCVGNDRSLVLAAVQKARSVSKRL